MEKKKYFFFDIDGILTDRADGRLIPSAVSSIQKLTEAGHFVSLATGRTRYSVMPFLEKLKICNMVCNGGNGIVYEGEVKEERPLDFEKAVSLYRQAQELGYGILVTIDNTPKVYADSFTFYEQAGMRKEETIDIKTSPNYDLSLAVIGR